MKVDRQFLWSVCRAVIETTPGWTLAAVVAIVLGVASGLCMAGVLPEPLTALLGAIAFSMTIGIFFPHLLVADLVTLFIVFRYTLTDVESVSSRVFALLSLFVIWAAVGFWMGYSFLPAMAKA